MKIIWTNWKLMWQPDCYRRQLFLLVFFALMIYRWHGETGSEESVRSLFDYSWYFALMMVLPISGILYAVIRHCNEVTAKPFAFCLPGYRQSLRGLLFIATLPWGVQFVLFQLPAVWKRWHFPDGAPPALFDVCLCLAAAFLIGAAVSLAVHGSRLALSKLQWGVLALASFPLGILAVGVWLGAEVDSRPLWIAAVVVSILTIGFFWVRLGDTVYVRRGHRNILADARDKRTQVDVKRTAPDWADDLFLVWAEQYPALSTTRYVWATFYRTFGLLLSYWFWMLLILGGLVFALQMGGGDAVEMVLLPLGLVAAMVDLPTNSSLLLSGGRRQRYYATLAVVVVLSLSLTAVAFAVVCVSGIIANGGGAGSGQLGSCLGSIWLATVAVPWIAALRLFKVTNLATEILTGLVVILAVHQILTDMATPMLCFAIVAAVGWVFFLGILQYTCAQGGLISSPWRSATSEGA